MVSTRVLLVEDEIIISEDIKSTLKRLDYTVVGNVATGQDAVDVADKERPDIILMDIKLQGEMDGIDATNIIRSQLNIPVVYLTSHSDTNTLERAKVTHPFGYIIKPFTERELYSNIEMALYKHNAEERLKESEERFRSIIDAASDAIISTDAEELVTSWNPAAEKMFSYSKDEALGEELRSVIPPRFYERTRQFIIGEAQSRKKGNTHEGAFQRKDGSEFPAEMTATNWTSGGKTFYTAIIRDISQRKRVENEREQLILELQEALAKIDKMEEE